MKSLKSPARKCKVMTKMQIQTMDHMMDVWEEQIKSQNAPSAMLSKLKDLPGFGATGSWPNADAFQRAAMNPLQLYMQFTQQCQKGWTDTASFWTKAGQPLSS